MRAEEYFGQYTGQDMESPDVARKSRLGMEGDVGIIDLLRPKRDISPVIVPGGREEPLRP